MHAAQWMYFNGIVLYVIISRAHNGIYTVGRELRLEKMYEENNVLNVHASYKYICLEFDGV